MKDKDEILRILREINNNPNLHKSLANKVQFSLGKLNYCLSLTLKDKGLIKINNFKKNKNRFNLKSKNNYLYILTPKGIAHKTELAINFLRENQEYNEIKKKLVKEDKIKFD